MGNGIPEINIHPRQIKWDDDEEQAQSFGELLAKGEDFSPQEIFDVVNFVSEDYSPFTQTSGLNQKQTSALEAPIGTSFTDMASINQFMRNVMGVDNPRVKRSFLGQMEENYPAQFYDEELLSKTNFAEAVRKGYIKNEKGEFITHIKGEAQSLSPGQYSAFSRGVKTEDQWDDLYASYLEDPSKFLMDKSFARHYELQKAKENLAYGVGAQTGIETPWLAGIGLDPRLTPVMTQSKEDPKVWFDNMNSTQYYMFVPGDGKPESDKDGKLILTKAQKEYLSRMKSYDPDGYQTVMDAIDMDRPFGTLAFKEGRFDTGGTLASKTAEELGITNAPEGAVFVPITKELGPAESAYVYALKNMGADANTSYGVSQLFGALGLELLPGVGILGGVWAGRAAVKSGVLKPKKDFFKRYGIKKDIDESKVAFDGDGNLTEESIIYLRNEKNIGSEVLDRVQGDMRRDIFALKTRQQNIADTTDINLITYRQSTSYNRKGVTDPEKFTVNFRQVEKNPNKIKEVIGEPTDLMIKHSSLSKLPTKPETAFSMTGIPKDEYNNLLNETFQYVKKLVDQGYTLQEVHQLAKALKLPKFTHNQKYGAFAQMYNNRMTGLGLPIYTPPQIRVLEAPFSITKPNGSETNKWSNIFQAGKFSTMNMMADAFVNFLRNGEEGVLLSPQNIAKFYTPSKAAKTITINSAKDVNLLQQRSRHHSFKYKPGGPDKNIHISEANQRAGIIPEEAQEYFNLANTYIAQVMRESGDPAVIKYLDSFGNDSLAIDSLRKIERIESQAAGSQVMIKSRSINKNEPEITALIHTHFGKTIEDEGADFFQDIENLRDVSAKLINSGYDMDEVAANKAIVNYLLTQAGQNKIKFHQSSFWKNPNRANEILDQITQKFYYGKKGFDMIHLANIRLGESLFKNQSLYNKLRKDAIKNLGITDSVAQGERTLATIIMDEPVSRTVASRNNNEPYTLFIRPLSEIDNRVKGSVFDRALGIYLPELNTLNRNGNLTKAKFQAINKKIIEASEDIAGAPKLVWGPISELNEKKLRLQFPHNSEIVEMFITKAKENGYHFKLDGPDGLLKLHNIISAAKSSSTKLDEAAAAFRSNGMGGRPVSREKFKEGSDDPYEQQLDQWGKNTGDLIGSIGWAVDEHTKNVQEDILNMYKTEIVEPFYNVRDKLQLEQEEVEDFLSDKLNPPKPVKFKWSETPRLLTENPLLKQAGATIAIPEVPVLETIELLYNGIRSGVENDIQMEEFFPEVYSVYHALKGPGVRETPKEQEYISMIDEINRAQETGVTNFAYSVVDLALSIPDAIFPTEFTDELKKRYEEADLNKPETFLGQIGALAIEFGIPGGVAFKVINRFRKLMLAKSGGKVNLFTQKTYALEGLPKLGVQISNVAKRVGTGTISFGVGDFVAGGPYNTISEMFDDPLISSKLVGEYEDTSELSGKERVAANFRNRLRFGAEGAMIGGLFPLVGPALGVVGKNVLLKPALWVGGGALKTANVLAIKPATWLASKDPLVLPGIARGAGTFAKFLGTDVLARLAATAATGGRALVPSLKGNYGQLPEFNKWRMFDVTSNDPLQRGLKKVDNFLKWFRDSGNQALYAFNLSGGAERFIKSKAREIEKYLASIETKSYDLANGFLQRYNKAITSPAGQQHMLDQIHEYLRGNLKLSKIEPELQELAKALKEEFNAIKTAYFKELPEGSGLRAALESNLDKYMRMSFATFSNPSYKPSAQVLEDATNYMVGIIKQNEDFIEAAVKGSKLPADEAIREFARRNVDNMIAIGKAEGIDPLNALNKIQKEILRGENFIQTGEELPNVIKKLLGQEKNLKHSVMMTAGSLVTQTANIKTFKEFARHGLENGYLFTSRAEALAAGIADPKQIGSLPGLGQMQDLAFADKGGPIGLFASGEMKASIEGTGGMLDNLLQNSFYQSLIAYKAAVQTGKTVFSPATQSRNFGSAGFFPMHVGHIGGNASVTDAFKIVLDDIFGAGRTVNEVDLIKRITRKVELGVLDENIVASELGAILKDIKAGKLNSLGKLAERAENSKFYKSATRVYAGGDNVWKWYGHEYYMSQLKGGFRNLDDIKKFFTLHGIEFNPKNIMTGSMKTLDEGIEEAAAYLLRETYPTYSKVPEFIKAIRKLPIGNFVSFTSEILRTGFATSSIAMKHIASDNQALREMGYRMLSGQAITLGGMTAGVQGLGHALTNVTPEQLEVYKKYFAPEYMKYSSLIPVSNVEEGGVFKVFDFSRYYPYDIITSSARELLKVTDRRNYSKDLAVLKEQLSQMEDPSTPEAIALRNKIKQLKVMVDMSTKLDPKKIETEVFSQYLNTVGPLWNAVTGTFFGIPIGGEAFIEAATGKTREGSTIWSEGMTNTEKFDRGMNHFFQTIEPGLISSGRKLFHAARGDVSGVGQPLEIDTEIFKLMGGSNVTIDVLGSLDFKISDFQQSFREPKMGKSWYTPKNFKQRGPEQLVLEYREQNEQAFRAQYEFYKAAMAAIDSGLLTRSEVIQALKKRIAPNAKDIPTKIIMLLNGRFTPITYGPEGLKSRMNKIYRNNPDIDRRIYHYQYFYPYGPLEREKNKWKNLRFEDFERQQKEPEQVSAAPAQAPVQTAAAAEPQVAPIPNTGTPKINPTQIAAGNVDQATGLTQTETALLSPTEKAIRLRQRGMA